MSRLCLLVLPVILLTGCAHDLTISPNLDNLPRVEGTAPIHKKVGYFISDSDRQKTVKTPGGGGDFVQYPLYANMEAGLYRTLSNVFTNVAVLRDPRDTRALAESGVTLVFTPVFTSTSSSRNIMFWPPTDFSITINCTATNPAGEKIWETTVTGTNSLTSVSSIIHDFGMTGRDAAESALTQLQKALEAAPELRR